MQEGQLLMTQTERDRLVALKKAKKKLITQREAATEMELSIRQVQRLLGGLPQRGDKVVVHGLRGQPSNRKIDEKIERRAVEILSLPVYQGFGPTLAAEYLRNKHRIEASKETVRQWMMRAKLWRGKQQQTRQVHLFRERRSRWGELVQWDTSEHDWLEGRGEKLYLIAMIDDATSRLFARFVRHDSTAENMKLLWSYVEKFGRPLAFYTDKASLFQTTEKRKRDEPGVEKDPVEMPPTQIGRALRELGISWVAAHSPQAKGRVERNFQTAQDRLVPGEARLHCALEWEVVSDPAPGSHARTPRGPTARGAAAGQLVGGAPWGTVFADAGVCSGRKGEGDRKGQGLIPAGEEKTRHSSSAAQRLEPPFRFT
jgi:hypothetical protein